MPPDIVTRQVDVTTNMLATPYCPSTVVANEFFIPGTDPMLQCDVHNSSTLYPDTSGIGGLVPRDTSRRFRDSAIFALPPRDTTKKVPRRDTIRPPKIPPDTSS